MEACELVDWSRTSDALKTLISLFTCTTCRNTLQEPCSFQMCDHYFCRMCAMELINTGTNCPVCDAVLWREHLQANLKIPEVMKICEQIRTLICKDEKDEENNFSDVCNTYVFEHPASIVEQRENDIKNNANIGSNVVFEIEDDSPTDVEDSEQIADIKNTECSISFPEPLSIIILRNNTDEDGVKKKDEVNCNAFDIATQDDDDVVDLDKELHSNHIINIQTDNVNVDDVDVIKEMQPTTAMTSIKCKGKRKGIPLNIVAENEDVRPSPSPEKSQFSEAVSDQECAQGVQRNPKGSMKKPKFTYGKKKKGLSNENMVNNNTTKTILVTEERSVFDFCSGTITKTISFGGKDNVSNDEVKETVANVKNCSKRKRGGESITKTSIKNTDRTKDKDEGIILLETKENDNEKKEKSTKRKVRNLEKRNKKGETTLHTACIKGNYERVKELLELGAQSNTKDFNGWTPLHEASIHGFVNIVELLLDYNAIIDCVAGEDNDTPLHDAVSNNRVEVTRLLLQRGAPITIKNCVGVFPEGYAYTNEMKSIFKEMSMIESNEISDNHLNTSSTTLGVPFLFITTNLRSFEKVEIKKCCDLLGAQLTTEFNSSVTHVICGTDSNGISLSRTMKYLLGVLTGKWLVSLNWINESLKKNKWEVEAYYEVKGSPGGPEEIPQKSRINHFKSLPKLFEGCSFYFSGIFQESLSKESLMNLIKLGGGKLLYREPKTSNVDPSITPLSPAVSKLKIVSKLTSPLLIYHAKENSAQVCCKEYIIYDVGCNPVHKKVCSPVLCTAPVAWLLDCVSNFQILDVQDTYDQKDEFRSSPN